MALIPYEDCAKYSALTNAHMGFNPSEAEYKTIINAMDFEDAKEALVSNSPIADRFLEGTWKTSDGKYYLTLDGFSCRSNNVYTPKYELYMISDGVLSFLRSSTDVFKFTVLTEDSISVYCYKDGSTYTLYRQ